MATSRYVNPPERTSITSPYAGYSSGASRTTPYMNPASDGIRYTATGSGSSNPYDKYGWTKPSGGSRMLPAVMMRDPVTGDLVNYSTYLQRKSAGTWGEPQDDWQKQFSDQLTRLQEQLLQLTQNGPWDGFFEKLQEYQKQQEEERKKREGTFDWNNVLWGAMLPTNGYGMGSYYGGYGFGNGYRMGGGFPFGLF